MKLATPIEEIPGIGEATSQKFKKIGIETAQDLLFHIPHRYEYYPKYEIKDAPLNENVNISGKIKLIQNKRSYRSRISITEAILEDGTDEIKVIWFNQPFITKNLKEGDKLSVAGKINLKYEEKVITPAEYEKIFSTQRLIHTRELVPNYASTERLTQKQIRFIISKVSGLIREMREWIDDNIREKANIIDIKTALCHAHYPINKEEVERAKERFAFGELFLLQLKSLRIKNWVKSKEASPMKFMDKEVKEFVKCLPFSLTDAQKKASWRIIKDMERISPMTRLVEGDVGSGKTLVAVMAVANTALNPGFNQSILMVPTEVLAEQHFNSISDLLSNLDIKISILTKDNQKTNFSNPADWDKKKIKERKDKITEESHLIIGTHSLIQEDINFKNLVLSIIDEQHRFGVEQRKKLAQKSGNLTPHLLSMTATPIPRSLALALFGDLDLSIIDQMPAKRKPITTKIIPEKKRDETYDLIREQIKKGRQVFVICPLIDPSDKLGVKSSVKEAERLEKEVFKKERISLLHGRMKQKEKERIMRDFLAGKIDILVSTSVIEVGVDVPNASIMVIEGADRFGLAQLHQFRGRVGRGEHRSYCFLFPENRKKETSQRLKAMEEHADGFSLAKIDMKIRGCGDIFGRKQKGIPELKVADLLNYQLMEKAKKIAEETIDEDPEMNGHPRLKRLLDRWSESIHLE